MIRPTVSPSPVLPGIKYVSSDQIRALLSQITSHRDKAMFTVAYWRGLRAGEVGMLMREEYFPDSGRLYVRREKNGISGEYALSPDERKAMTAWLKVRGDSPGPLFPSRRGTGISRKMLDVLVRHYGGRAGWPPDKTHFHVLRHSIATHLLEKGLDIKLVQDWLGHRNLGSTQIYAQITNKARRNAEALAYAEGETDSHSPAASATPKVRVSWSADNGKGKAKAKGKVKVITQ